DRVPAGGDVASTSTLTLSEFTSIPVILQPVDVPPSVKSPASIPVTGCEYQTKKCVGASVPPALAVTRAASGAPYSQPPAVMAPTFSRPPVTVIPSSEGVGIAWL